jgi:hypothetical protein
MKRIIHLIFLTGLILSIHSGYAQPPGQWTWLKGSNITGDNGSFGVQGVANPTNVPPSFYEAMEWTDLQGNFWLFGGSHTSGGLYADLWKYDVATNNWTWVKGPGINNPPGVYGTQGVPSPANYPKPRAAGGTWVDASGNLWLFGGGNYFGTPLNDLWRYNIATNEWTWMKGSNAANQQGVYGTLGVPAMTNVPGSRTELGTTWSDNNNLWIFGGWGQNNSAVTGSLNDLWKYDISTNQWTWMYGTTALNIAANYGTIGVASATNTPGGRYSYSKWKDAAGNFWFFGGALSSSNNFNDLWKFDRVVNQWVWVSGASGINQQGVYGTVCVPATGNRPVSKFENRNCWTDACGNFWSYGGCDDGGFTNKYNDLWRYNPTTNQWTFINGATTSNAASIYGTINVSAPTNNPGARCGSNSWYDNTTGNLFMFGGGAANFPTCKNDMWRYVPDPLCGGCSVNIPLAVTLSLDTSVCAGNCASISATPSNGTPPYTFSWTPNVGSSAGPFSVCPAANTTYSVTVTDSVGDTVTGTTTITVNPLPIISAAAPTPVCVGDSAALTVIGASTYSWSPCINLSSCSGSSVMASPASTTPYTVTGTDVNGCSSMATVTVVVNPLPVLVAPSSPVTCSGDAIVLSMSGAVSYHWSPSAGLSNPNGADSTSVTATLNSSTTFTVTGYSANGCSATSTFTVIVNPNPTPVITPSGPTSFCTGGSVDLLASPVGTYLWSNNETTSSIHVTQSGTFTITVTDANGCSGISAPVQVTENPNPPALLTPNGVISICNTNGVMLNANAGDYGYTWYLNGVVVQSGSNSGYMAISAGVYQVQVSDLATGCTSMSQTATIVQGGGGPVASVVGSGGCGNFVFPGYSTPVTLTGTAVNAVSYLWSPGGQTTASIQVTQPGTYCVTAYDAIGCPSDSPACVVVGTADIRCGQNLQKVILCHVPPGNPGNPQTLCIAWSAVPAHLGNHPGDCLGPCSLYFPRLSSMASDDDISSFSIIAYPNPFSGTFSLEIFNSSGEPMNLVVYDVLGRIVESHDDVNEHTLVGENLRKGIYFVEAVQGDSMQRVRIVKGQ